LSRDLNVYRDVSFFTCSGGLRQTVGPETEKAQSLNFVAGMLTRAWPKDQDKDLTQGPGQRQRPEPKDQDKEHG